MGEPSGANERDADFTPIIMSAHQNVTNVTDIT